MKVNDPAAPRRRGFALLVGLFLWAVPWGAAAQGETPEASPLLERFESGYRQVLRDAGSGVLPVAAGAAAADLWRELHHELAERDDALRQLTSQLRQAPAPEREALAARLIAGGAARERLVMEYVQRLERLTAGGSEDRVSGAGAISAAPSPEEAPEPGLRLEFGPEDLSRGRFE